MVEPDMDKDGEHIQAVVPLDTMVRAVHLIGVNAGSDMLPRTFKDTDTLDHYLSFYMNKYADHHAHETISVPIV